MAQKVSTFNFDRETKGAVRYKEDAPDGQEIIGQLYVRKSGLALMGETGELPKSIQVAVLTGDDVVTEDQ